MSGETTPSSANQTPEPTGWEELEHYATSPEAQSEFAGETNINRATGKERTFSQFDKFPRQEGETSEEYGERLKRINELEAAAQDELYRTSDRYQQEQAAEAEYDRLTAKLEQAVAEGRMSEEAAKRYAERELEKFDATADELRQKFQEDQVLQNWVDSSDVHSRAAVLAEMEAANAEETDQTAADELEKAAAEENEKSAAEAEEKEKVDAEEKEKAEAEEREKLEAAEREKAEREAKNREIEAILNPEGEENEETEAIDVELPFDEIEQEIDQDALERQQELEERLEKMLPNLAELYAKSRRVFDFSGNRAKFAEVKSEYAELMDEYLRLKAKNTYETGKSEVENELQERLDEIKADIESKLTEFTTTEEGEPDKTPAEVEAERQRLIEEATEALKAEYQEKTDDLEAEVNAEFLADFIDQQAKLEDATIDRLDNGTFCRKVVSKVLSSKALRNTLIVAGIAGLAVTGVGLAAGLAAGTMSVGLTGFTASGIAAGAARGGLAGAIMSRQSSKNSAVRDFANEEDIRGSLEGINILNENVDTQNVTEWLLDQYEGAKDADLSSNRKRTAISAGLGAAMGALMSGVQFKDGIIETEVPQGDATATQATTTPVEYHAANLNQVNIPQGSGSYETFAQLGGDPANYQQFEAIMYGVDANYGLVPGSNGEVAGFNGLVGQFAHTYPGTIDTWPDVARAYITEVADEAARQGLIPSVQTGGNVIDTITTAADPQIVRDVAKNLIPAGFLNIITQAITTVGAGVAGSFIGNRQNQAQGSEAPRPIVNTPPEPEPESEAPEEEPDEAPDTEPEVDSNAPTEPIEPTSEAPSETSPEGSEPAPETEQPEEPESTSEPSEPAPEPSEQQPAQPEPAPEPEPEGSEPSERQPRTAEQDREFVRAADEYMSNQIRNEVINSPIGRFLDDEGVNIISMQEPTIDNPAAQADNEARIVNFWNSLSDEAKDAIIEYENANNRAALSGSALRNWLQRNNLIERPNVDPSRVVTPENAPANS